VIECDDNVPIIKGSWHHRFQSHGIDKRINWINVVLGAQDSQNWMSVKGISRYKVICIIGRVEAILLVALLSVGIVPPVEVGITPLVDRVDRKVLRALIQGAVR